MSRITFRANTSRNRVQEGSALTITAKFWTDTSETWTAQTPTTIHYRIDCLTTGAEILGWTSIAAATSATISVTGAQNVIQSDHNEWETKQVTVKIDTGLSTQYQEAMTYEVRNLSGQT